MNILYKTIKYILKFFSKNKNIPINKITVTERIDGKGNIIRRYTIPVGKISINEAELAMKWYSEYSIRMKREYRKKLLNELLLDYI